MTIGQSEKQRAKMNENNIKIRKLVDQTMPLLSISLFHSFDFSLHCLWLHRWKQRPKTLIVLVFLLFVLYPWLSILNVVDRISYSTENSDKLLEIYAIKLDVFMVNVFDFLMIKKKTDFIHWLENETNLIHFYFHC